VVAPGGMQTDFAGRSLQGGMHNADSHLVAKVSEGYSEEQVANYTKAADVAQVIYDASTDEKDQLTEIAGNDALTGYSGRMAATPEGPFKQPRSQFIF